MKRVAAINDISGFGKCSLTIALPILSCAGIETCPIPTAILSTHTGGFTGYTYRDLTSDLREYYKHWKSLDLKFSAIYSGFLGSVEQVDIVSEIIDAFKSKETLVIVDPAMADNGQMYSVFDKSMCSNMARLCSKADIIVPNLTEATFMLGQEYVEAPYTKEYIHDILQQLTKLGAKKIVLTGTSFSDDQTGATCYDTETDTIYVANSPKIAGNFHGTGDVFASFLLAALLNNKDLSEATQFAVDLTYECITKTAAKGTPTREGVDFESVLPKMIQKLNLA
jgi:pyridoxine kinase